MTYKPPTYGFLFIKNKAEKKPGFRRALVTGTELAPSVHTTQARLLGLSGISWDFHSWFLLRFGSRAFARSPFGLLGLDYCHTHAGVTLLFNYKVKGLCFGCGVVLIPLWTVLVLHHEGLAFDLFHSFLQRIRLGDPDRFPGRGLYCYLTGLLSQSCLAYRRLREPCRGGRRICWT